MTLSADTITRQKSIVSCKNRLILSAGKIARFCRPW